MRTRSSTSPHTLQTVGPRSTPYRLCGLTCLPPRRSFRTSSVCKNCSWVTETRAVMGRSFRARERQCRRTRSTSTPLAPSPNQCGACRSSRWAAPARLLAALGAKSPREYPIIATHALHVWTCEALDPEQLLTPAWFPPLARRPTYLTAEAEAKHVGGVSAFYGLST